MPIPKFMVNGPRVSNPVGGVALCELNPPFTQHQTLELLVHCPAVGVELRHYGANLALRNILICVNRDVVYLTVEPNERLGMYLAVSASEAYVQGSLYAF